jgi:cob(I)alamin adenosyltransferase
VKIYSRKGDTGETAMVNGRRVSKAAPRVDAQGEVDELNFARANATHPELQTVLEEIQRDLFSIGALLAGPGGERKFDKVSLDATDVGRLEQHIDHFDSRLPDLKRFILPGGARGGALLHQARTVCRRAERRLVALAESEPIPSPMTAYLNRLSDLLFVAARLENHHQGVDEVTW